MTTNNPTGTEPRELARFAAESETPPALVVYAIPNGDGELESAIGVEGLALNDVLKVLNRAADIVTDMDKTERDGGDDA